MSTTIELQEAWKYYHDTLEKMRVVTEATARYQDNPQNRAKAFHTLMEVQAMAYNFAIAPRLSHPRIYVNSCWQTDLYTLGQNCQDMIYATFYVDGRHRYRLTGRNGTVKFSVIQTHNGLFGDTGVDITGNYDWADFDVAPDGSFEISISADEQPGNWIKIDPTVEYQFMFIRRVITDWFGDPGELHLERITDMPQNYYDADEFDETAMAVRIRRAAEFVRYMVQGVNIGLYDTYLKNAGRKNILTLLPGTTTSQASSPSSNYAMAVFELTDDEALVISMDKAPDGVYWSFQTGDVWSRSLDFANRQSSLGDHEVCFDEDGSFHIVVSARDPGVHNWVDTCGRTEGTIVFRNYRARTSPVPKTSKVLFSELDSVLPAYTKRVTSEERAKNLANRRLGQLNLYGE